MYKWFLLANGAWDLLCAGGIFLDIPYVGAVHMAYWTNTEDSNNLAARHLMAHLVLTWGCMRLASFAGMGPEWAFFSYLIEGFVFGTEAVLFRLMHVAQALAVALLSCALAILFVPSFTL